MPVHRSRIQRERITIEPEMSAGALDPTRAVTLEHARRFLKTLGENIAFEGACRTRPRPCWASRRVPGPSGPCCPF